MPLSGIRIVIVDEHEVCREGLRALMKGESDFEVLAQGHTGADAVRLVQMHTPDVILLSVSRRGPSFIETIREIRKLGCGVKVLGISEREDKHILADLIHAGGSGCVLKLDSFKEFAKAIRILHSGNSHFSPRVADALADIVRQKADKGAGAIADTLSAREKQVLRLVADGRCTREIASDLCIGVKTVETHRKNIMDKLNLRGVAQLTKYAIREGMVSLM